jgi:hypothetical protein
MLADPVSFLRASWPVALETAFVLLALPIAFVKPGLGSGFFQSVERALGRLARKPGLAVLAVILIALAGRAALLEFVPIPVPGIHDEYSYLLMADTFANGRLTNPTHPMWKHFETFHVNQQPTYCSKYPVAQGVFLAVGEVLAGHPWFGVWLSSALMCGAICWMLQGWLPPGWALYGGLLAVIRLGLFSYWVNSYWGGAAAAIGGSLALGALPRILRNPRMGLGVWMGLGISILANSRPYEGLALTAGITATLLYRAVRGGASFRRALLARVAPPISIVLLATAIFMGVYFKATTGNPFLSPYQVNQDTYGTFPLPRFVWQKPSPLPQYRYREMAGFFIGWDLGIFNRAKTFEGFARLSGGKLASSAWFFLGPALALSLLMAGPVVKDRRVRPLLWIGLCVAAACAVQAYYAVHYAAPAAPLLLALTLQGFRHLRVWKPSGKPAGLFLVRVVPVILLIMAAIRIGFPPGPVIWSQDRYPLWCCTDPGNLQREKLTTYLENYGGRHLVMVHYKPTHNYHDEWVFNAADIDNSKVVFAREMDAASDAELFHYFEDRLIWVLMADDNPIALAPYRPSP